MEKNSSILIVGHGDVTDKALISYFRGNGFTRVQSSHELRVDPVNFLSVRVLIERDRPDYVILTSVRSGGIGANQAVPAELMYGNLQAQNNVLHLAYENHVKKLLFVGASCVYPKDCQQPMKEEYFLTGPFEKTSEPYSMAKAAGIVMCQAYRRQYGFNAIAMVPATVYGPGQAMNVETAHVLGALVSKFTSAVQAQSRFVSLWGTGEPRREFLFSDDFASACHFLLDHYEDEALINVGTGTDVSIRDLAAMVREISGFSGEVQWDASKSDGTMRKLLDSSKLLAMGWKPRYSLADGLRRVMGQEVDDSAWNGFGK